MTIGDLNGDGERGFNEGLGLAGYLTDVDSHYHHKYGDGREPGCGSMGCGCVTTIALVWLLGTLVLAILGA